MAPDRGSLADTAAEPRDGLAATYLFVVPWDTHHVGGVNGVVLNLARTMRGLSNLEPLIAINDWSARGPLREGDEVRFRFAVLGALSPVALAKSLVQLPGRLLALLRLLRDERVAVVNFHYLSDTALGVALLKLAGAYRGKLIVSLHGADAARPSSRLRRAAVRLSLRAADAIVVVSKGLAARTAQQLDVPLARLTIIGNGVDHSVFRPGAADAAVDRVDLPAHYLASVGRYIPRKDHGTTVRAFASLAARYPDLHLCIAGDDGEELEPLRRLCAELGVGQRVHFFQSLSPPQVAMLLARATLFVQVSLSEGLPLTAIEAAATGTAMVLSDIPGHDEIVEPGVSGLLFPVKDPAACAAAVARLLDDRELRAEMARRQLEAAVERFSWPRCVTASLAAVGLPSRAGGC
jgi:glycogen(starch) synthase